jgi:hypothetical protein
MPGLTPPCHAPSSRSLPSLATIAIMDECEKTHAPPLRTSLCQDMPRHANPCLADPGPAMPCLQRFRGKSPKLWPPIAGADHISANSHNLCQLAQVNYFRVVTDLNGTGPSIEPRPRAHNGALAYFDGISKPETWVFPQIVDRLRSIILNTVRTWRECSCLDELSKFPLSSCIQQETLPIFPRHDWETVLNVEAGIPFNPRHFLVIGIGLIFLARYLLYRFRKVVQWVFRLSVVYDQGCYAGNPVLLGEMRHA